MSAPLRPRTTMAFFAQPVVSFAVSLAVTITGIGYLHDSRWIRAFLARCLLYVVTSSFTLVPLKVMLQVVPYGSPALGIQSQVSSSQR